MKLVLGDCLEKLKELEDNSVDSIVTDPPYGLEFMGKKWDYDVPSTQIWEECMRVLKPGGHLLSFAGSRTYHRMAVRIEDAGFEIRDQIMWVYGSGFPKSHNIGKAVDKLQGNEREVIGPGNSGRDMTGGSYGNQGNKKPMTFDITKGNSEWEGWGTALKPAHEPIVMARKPFKGSVADNVLEWGTGGINIDGCRIAAPDNDGKVWARGGNGVNARSGPKSAQSTPQLNGKTEMVEPNPNGRFPANIIFECTCENIIEGDKGEIKHSSGSRDNVNLTHEWGYKDIQRTNYTDTGNIHTDPNCPCYILDQQSGTTKSSKRGEHNNKNTVGTNTYTPPQAIYSDENTYGDSGGASRFFYCPKANKSDRNEGMPETVPQFTGRPRREDGSVIYKETHPEEWAEAMKDKPRKEKTSLAAAEEIIQERKIKGRDEGQDNRSVPHKARPVGRMNIHPTVKPTDLMAYLIRLVTPKGGIVLDPFMGSGSTGKAAVREGMEFIGIEREAEYMEIARQRIGYELDKKQLEESKRKFW